MSPIIKPYRIKKALEGRKRLQVGVSVTTQTLSLSRIKLALALRQAGAYGQPLTLKQPLNLAHLDGLIVGGDYPITPTIYARLNSIAVEDIVKFERATGRIMLMAGMSYLRPFFRFLPWQVNSLLVPNLEAQDRMDYRLIWLAMQQGLPILGIDRGMYLLNLACQGTLMPNRSSAHTLDSVDITPVWYKKAKLADIYRDSALNISNINHAYITRLGANLSIAAQSECGHILAIEHTCHPFTAGMAWHPAHQPWHSTTKRLFAEFVGACHTKRREKSNSNTYHP